MPRHYATSDDWEPHREIISRIYCEESRTLEDTVDIMAREYNFLATARMFKTRLRKWGLYKYQTKPKVHEIPNRGFDNNNDNNNNNNNNDTTGITFEVAGRGYHSDLTNLGKYIRKDWDIPSYGACLEFNVEGGISSHIPLPYSPAGANTSIPAIMRAPDDLQYVEEALRITDGYIQGSIESGAWSYNEQLHDICGPRGFDGWDDTWVWLCRVVKAVQYIQVSRTRDGFRLLGACLDEMAAHLRYQDSTIIYYFMIFSRIRNKALRQALIRHSQNLATVVLGSRHPFTLIFERLATLEARSPGQHDIPVEFMRLIGAKYNNFEKPLRLCPPHPAAAAAAAAASEEVGPDTGFLHLLESFEDKEKLVVISRAVRETIWQNDPKDPIIAIAGFDLQLVVVRGLRLHGETVEVALGLDSIAQWLSFMNQDIYNRKEKYYYEELKQFSQLVLDS